MKHFLICILMILVACNKQPTMESNRLTITVFSTSFDTKATETAFEAGDKIGIFLENNTPNLRYETADGSTWSGFGNLTQFKTGDNAIAYYPYSETASSQSAIEVSSGVDFMVCPKTPLTIADNKASAALNFKHMLSKLVVSMEIPSEINGLKTVSIESITVKNVFRKGVIDITTKAITGLTDRGDVVLTNGEVIIIPQTISRIEFSFKMANGTTERLAHTKDLTLTPGTKTTLQAISNADLYFTSFLNLSNGEAQTDLPLSFYVAPGRTWKLKSSEPWLAFSATHGVGAATVKVNVSQNAGTPRTAIITLTDDKQAITTQKPMQNNTRIPTVEIAGTKWTTANLTGIIQGQTSGFTIESTPQGLGMFWKWGSKYMYNRIGGYIPSGHWDGSQSTGASAQPTTQSKGYDYANLSITITPSDAGPAGDPCQSLGSNYKTPTQTQWTALKTSGATEWTSYQGVPGCFLGPKATSCNNAILQPGCIFIPAAGYREWHNGALLIGNYGFYWSSSVLNINNGWSFLVGRSGSVTTEFSGVRSIGLSVRCVAE